MRDLRRFLVFYRPVLGWAALGVFLAFITVGANVALMAVSGWFVAAMALAGAAGAGINYFTPAAIIRALSITRTGGRYAERLSTHGAALRVSAAFRPWLFGQMVQAQDDAAHSGDTLSRLRGDVDTLEKFYMVGVVPMGVCALAFPFVAAALLYICPPLAFVQLALMAGVGVLVPLALMMAGRSFHAQALRETTRLRVMLTNYLQGMDEWMVYDIGGAVLADIASCTQRLQALQYGLARQTALAQGVALGLTLLAAPAALVFALPMVRAGDMPPAYFAMLPLMAMAAFEIVGQLPAAIQAVMAGKLAAARVFALADAGVRHGGAGVQGDGFLLSMRDVGFSYADGRRVLAGFNLTLAQGGVVTLRGPSGIGKTTIAHLITGLHVPDSGAIHLNGQDYAVLDGDALRARFAVAEQRPYIFMGSIRANLLRAKPDADEAQMREVCACAGLLDEITAMPAGFDAVLGEGGAGLSGGQLRRLAVARALLKDGADCLIFDEPGEGLDATEARAMMERVLARVQGKKAVLIITHQRHLNFGRPITL